MKRLLGRRGVAAALVVVVAIAVGGIAYASIPDANGVIHGCYRPTTGQLIVATNGKGCEEGWTPLNWSQTGPTGATGPTGTLSSAYLDAFVSGSVLVGAGHAVPFNVVPLSSGISPSGLPPFTTFTVAASGVYQVTVDLQGNSVLRAQLTINGVNAGPSVDMDCASFDCTFTRLFSLSAGDAINLINVNAITTQVTTHSGITIVRIA